MIQRNLDCFRLHRLVQTVIRHRLPADRQEIVLARVLALLAAAHPGFDDPANRAAYARLVAPHLFGIGSLTDQLPRGDG